MNENLRTVLVVVASVGLVTTGAVGIQGQEHTVEETLDPENPGTVDELWSQLRDGGILSVRTPDGTAAISMDVSSVIVPRDENGTPQPQDREVVLRGAGSGASAAVILGQENATFLVNGLSENTIKIYVPPRDLPATPDDVASQDHDPHPDPLSDTGELESVLSDAASLDGSLQKVHSAPEGGNSVAHSKHIHTEDGGGDPNDPMNAMFYHHGTDDLIGSTLNDQGWDNSEICGSGKYLFMFDADHGGTDDWNRQQDDFAKNDAFCTDARHHLRQYTSPTGDTHSPGFEDYTLAPVHWEDAGHDFVDPQRGQDELLSDMSDSSDVRNIRFVQLPNEDSNCTWCQNWDGWVDFHERILSTHTDPCLDDGDPSWTIGVTHIQTVVTWECS